MHKALFLDRDGIINEDLGYVFQAQQFVFKTEIFALIKQFRQADYKVFVVTNQSGIAREYYTIEDFTALTKWMLNELDKVDANIDDVFFCPHHPSAGNTAFTKHCECRKPRAGMLLQAAQKHHIDLTSSIMIGDKASDVEAALAANLAAAFWLTDYADDRVLSKLNQQAKQGGTKTTIHTITHLQQVKLL